MSLLSLVFLQPFPWQRRLCNVFVAVEPVETVVQQKSVGLGFFDA